MHSAAIADALGYAFGEEVIHRNNLVLVASRDRPQVSHG
jgi:hypothetical protein